MFGTSVDCLETPATPLNFYRLTRSGDEPCTVATRMRQSQRPGSWKIDESGQKSCDFRVVERNATDEIVVQYRDGYGVAGRVVDVESQLKNMPAQTNEKGPLRVQARPFTTVPQMGRGRGNPYLESIMQQSESIRERKDCGTVSGTPNPRTADGATQIPHLRQFVQNPRNLVEESADPNWIRGGAHSRLIVRDALMQ